MAGGIIWAVFITISHCHHLLLIPRRHNPMSSLTTFMSATVSSGQDTFSPSGSPPLILAFLAIGLFSAAMVFIFWQRIQGNRNWRLAAMPLNIDSALYFNLPIVNVDVPKLWDLSNGGNLCLRPR
jgi:hypothetical protein